MDEVAQVRLKAVWTSMKARCTDPRHRAYPYYGGRGVAIRFDSFQGFRVWAQSAGFEPGLWIDRIDSDGDYSPENCRWATPKQQQRNRSNNRMITAFGETKCLAEWAEDQRCAPTYDTLKQRLDAGWEPEEAISKASAGPASERTHCAQGHAFSEENTIIVQGGSNAGRRVCRACYNETRKERRRRARARGEKPR